MLLSRRLLQFRLAEGNAVAPITRGGVIVTDFQGLVSNAGRMAEGAGNASSKQVNLVCVSIGEISSRPGIRPVTFDEDEDE